MQTKPLKTFLSLFPRIPSESRDQMKPNISNKEMFDEKLFSLSGK